MRAQLKKLNRGPKENGKFLKNKSGVYFWVFFWLFGGARLYTIRRNIYPYGGAIHHHETTPDTVIMNTTFQKFICLITRTPQRNRTPSTRMMKEASPIHPYNKREKSTSCPFECTVETDRQHFFIFDPIYFVLMMNLVTQRSILFCSILFYSLLL